MAGCAHTFERVDYQTPGAIRNPRGAQTHGKLLRSGKEEMRGPRTRLRSLAIASGGPQHHFTFSNAMERRDQRIAILIL
jgi:hypothetical protein